MAKCIGKMDGIYVYEHKVKFLFHPISYGFRHGCHIDEAGTKYYLQDGKIHRENGPAIEYANGHKEWHRHDELHRTDGPAVECQNGDIEFHYNGHYVSFNKWISILSRSDLEHATMMKLKYG